MRETRLSGSEGGGAVAGSPYPYQDDARCAGFSMLAGTDLPQKVNFTAACPIRPGRARVTRPKVLELMVPVGFSNWA